MKRIRARFSPQPSSFTKSVVADATLDGFAELGDTVVHGYVLAPGKAGSERAPYGDVVLVDRLRAALARLSGLSE